MRELVVAEWVSSLLSYSLLVISAVMPLLQKIGRDRVLPVHLVPFLMHAMSLLKENQDNLLVKPDDDGAQRRMDVVRTLLQSTVKPMADTDIAALLQCPLSAEVQQSLELACAWEKEDIVKGLNSNRVLANARPHLQHLHLLHDALRLPDVEKNYHGALEEILKHAEDRRQLAVEALKSRSFHQVRSNAASFTGQFV